MRKTIINIFKLYQAMLSPMFGSRCRFHPSCSSYAVQCFEKHGLGKASWLVIKRIIRCQPMHPGGFDPVP